MEMTQIDKLNEFFINERYKLFENGYDQANYTYKLGVYQMLVCDGGESKGKTYIPKQETELTKAKKQKTCPKKVERDCMTALGGSGADFPLDLVLAAINTVDRIVTPGRDVDYLKNSCEHLDAISSDVTSQISDVNKILFLSRGDVFID